MFHDRSLLKEKSVACCRPKIGINYCSFFPALNQRLEASGGKSAVGIRCEFIGLSSDGAACRNADEAWCTLKADGYMISEMRGMVSQDNAEGSGCDEWAFEWPTSWAHYEYYYMINYTDNR